MFSQNIPWSSALKDVDISVWNKGLMRARNITRMLEKRGNPGLELYLFGLSSDVCLVLSLFLKV
jgi:hypothetical protein